MRFLGRFLLGLVLLGCLGASSLALADEQKPSLRFMLNSVDTPIQSREKALQDSVKDAPTPAKRGPEWEVLSDGSARYGTASAYVVVRNPCPEGSHKPLYPQQVRGLR